MVIDDQFATYVCATSGICPTFQLFLGALLAWAFAGVLLVGALWLVKRRG